MEDKKYVADPQLLPIDLSNVEELVEADVLLKSESPGPPPRPGLQWKPETSRWIRPESPHQEKLKSFVEQQKLRESIPNLQSAAPVGTSQLVKYLTEEVPQHAGALKRLVAWIEGYSELAMKGTEVPDSLVDKLYNDVLKLPYWGRNLDMADESLYEPFDEAKKDPSRLNKVLAVDAFAHLVHSGQTPYVRNLNPTADPARGSFIPMYFVGKLKADKYEADEVLTRIGRIVLEIMDELATRANLSDEAKSAKESLFRYVEQTSPHAFGRDDLNQWVNKDVENLGADLIEAPATLDHVYARKATDPMPDPYSVTIYDWLEKTLEIGGKQIKGVKNKGRQLEVDLYDSLKKACNEYLDKVAPGTTQHEIINGLGDVIDRWTHAQSKSLSETFDELYKAGLYAGMIDSGVRPTARLSDELVLRLLKTDPNRLGGKIKLFAKDIVKRFNKIITASFGPKGVSSVKDLVKEMREVVPTERYKLERIVRTEVAAVSNSGRLFGWSQDQYRYFYDYIWNATYDNRSKFISLWRANQNPLTYDEAKFMWEHQSQLFNGTKIDDTYNQRCSLGRKPIENERKGNRWEGDSSFIETMSLGF